MDRLGHERLELHRELAEPEKIAVRAGPVSGRAELADRLDGLERCAGDRRHDGHGYYKVRAGSRGAGGHRSMQASFAEGRQRPFTQAARTSHPTGTGLQVGGSHTRVRGAHLLSTSLRSFSRSPRVIASNVGAGSHSPQHVISDGCRTQSSSLEHCAGATVAGTVRSSST
jgi:hypothetical protein